MKIYKGDTGTAIILDSGADILNGEIVKISILKPGLEDPVVRDAEIFETTKAKYVTVADDFNVVGKYKMQIIITSGVGIWRGETVRFTVFEHFV